MMFMKVGISNLKRYIKQNNCGKINRLLITRHLSNNIYRDYCECKKKMNYKKGFFGELVSDIYDLTSCIIRSIVVGTTSSLIVIMGGLFVMKIVDDK